MRALLSGWRKSCKASAAGEDYESQLFTSERSLCIGECPLTALDARCGSVRAPKIPPLCALSEAPTSRALKQSASLHQSEALWSAGSLLPLWGGLSLLEGGGEDPELKCFTQKQTSFDRQAGPGFFKKRPTGQPLEIPLANDSPNHDHSRVNPRTPDSQKPRKRSAALTLSLLFLTIAILGGIPWLVAEYDPRYSSSYPDPYGPGYQAAVISIVSIIFVSIPASAVSLLCGLIARKRSRFSYLSIILNSLFLIYCGFVYLRWQQ